jgi:hypothetical protein
MSPGCTWTSISPDPNADASVFSGLGGKLCADARLGKHMGSLAAGIGAGFSPLWSGLGRPGSELSAGRPGPLSG